MDLNTFALQPINSQSKSAVNQSGASINPEQLTIEDLNSVRISLEEQRNQAADKLGADNRRQRKNLIARLNRRFQTDKTRHYGESQNLYTLKMKFYRTGKQIQDVQDQIISRKTNSHSC